MKLAVDVDYREDKAVAAGLLFSDWQSCEAEQKGTVSLSEFRKYEPGQFYKRELPCILELLKGMDPLPDTILIDGYVHLGEDQKPGLGAYLYQALEGKCAVIGVAKSRFRGTPDGAGLTRRGSRRPLYVTSLGIPQARAKRFIADMCGDSRIPLLLKEVDQLCRGEA
ncbi:MAG: endonuclease V [Anaerolineales bacterium]